MDYPQVCPKCNADLDGEDIYEVLIREFPDESKETINEWAGSYGWTPENKEKFKNVIHVTCLGDKSSNHWQCPKCNHEWQ